MTNTRPAGILVVDDDKAILDMVANALEREGYSVFTASSGAEALKVLSGNAGRIQAVLTDVVMPGMGGQELARKLRGRSPELRILFMSGYAEALEPGQPLLRKPFKFEELSRKVGCLVRGRQCA